MRTSLSFHRAVLTLAVLCLAACGGKVVTVVDQGGFDAMARRTAPIMKAKDILDSGGAYTTPMLSAFGGAPDDAGHRLAHRLDPAFRFRETDPALLPASFADAKALGDRLLIGPYGFVLEQGAQRVAASLLGLADWSDSGADAWFVQCRVNYANGDERTYYLVISDPEAARYRAEVLGIYDCRGGRCTTYLESGTGSLPGEEVVIDLLPGQQDITAPPAE